VEYVGTKYCGWQTNGIHDGGAPHNYFSSVQSKIEVRRSQMSHIANEFYGAFLFDLIRKHCNK
jgi:hypothetical protein